MQEKVIQTEIFSNNKKYVTHFITIIKVQCHFNSSLLIGGILTASLNNKVSQ